VYSRLAESHGAETARKYGAANLAGLRILRELLLPASFACDAEETDFYLYSLFGERHITAEYAQMRKTGMDCEAFAGTPAGFELPFAVKSGILLRNQLKFHPGKTVRYLAAQGKARIFEETEAASLSESGHGYLVKTESGHRIFAEKVISAANYPVLMPGNLSFLKLYRETAYGAVLAGAPRLSAMYYGIDGGYAYRSHGENLLVSGERHRDMPPPGAEEKPAAEAERLFPGSRTVMRWSGSDCCTHDGLPYAGSVRPGLYLASGFGLWGMTNSAAAALILSGLAAGETLWYSDVFSPRRNFLKGGGDSFLHHAGVSAAGMARNFTVPEMLPAEIRPGEAGIVSHNGKRAGAYRDEGGKLHLVSLKCPHLGCSLAWNPAAKTWDCPCHGSRFTADGVCIGNPAAQNIGLGDSAVQPVRPHRE